MKFEDPQNMLWHNLGRFYTVPAKPEQKSATLRGSMETLRDDDIVEIIARTPTPDAAEAIRVGRDSTQPLLGLISVLCGPQPLDDLVHEDLVTVESKTRVSIRDQLPWTRSEALLPEIQFDDESVEQIRRAIAHLQMMPANERSKRELALRWFWKALHEQDDVDKFLSYWIALEIFPMAGAHKPKLIAKFLADKLPGDFPPGDIERKLKIGQLFQIRGQIVKDGLRSFPALFRGFITVVYEITREVLRLSTHEPPSGALDKYL